MLFELPKHARRLRYMSSIAAISATGLAWMGSHAVAVDGVAGTAGASGASASGAYTNSTPVTGGDGTNGGNATGNSAPGVVGFAGGVGGVGGAGISASSGATITNENSITGGRGGNSGNGGVSSGGGGPGGPGGVGGVGGAGLSGSNLTIANNDAGSIFGGLGGNGGSGGLAWFASRGGDGGAGGAGGAGIAAATATIANSGLIRGGVGGTGGAGGASGGYWEGLPSWGGVPGAGGAGISGSALTITNTVNGQIRGGAGGGEGTGGAGVSGLDLNISNAGSIRGGLGGSLGLNMYAPQGSGIDITGGTDVINNLATGQIVGGGDRRSEAGAINVTAGSVSINNAGAITGGAATNAAGGHGILLQGGDTVITNTGSITSGVGSHGITITAGVASIVNLGTIVSADGYGIYVSFGAVHTLSNAQGGVKPLTYIGTAPTDYNVIVQSPTAYGQLVGTGLTGVTRFGVDPGSTLALGTYASVLQGFTSENIDPTNLTGKMGRFRWFLTEDTDPNTLDTWDLLVARGGPDAANTTLALQSNASALRNVLSQRTATISQALDYDCVTFDAKGYCVSFRARYTGMDSQNEGAGVLTAAHRVNANLRIGGFIDYRASEKVPAGLKQGDTMPTFGAFAVYSERGDNVGLQAKASTAYNSGKITVTRDNSLPDTEPGSGKAGLNSYAIGAELGWGVAISPTMLATPYVGVRYTDATRSGYQEPATDTVEYPIAYSAFYQRLTTATAGVRIAGMFSDKVGYLASIGGEYDLAHKANAYSGASTIPDLESFALANTGGSNRARVNASAGLYYQMDKTQRLTASVGVRGQAYSNQPSVTTLVGYQMAF